MPSPITLTGKRSNAGSPVTPPENQGGQRKAARRENTNDASAAAHRSGEGSPVQQGSRPQGSAISQIYASSSSSSSSSASASASAFANAQQISGWTKQAGGPASGSSGTSTVQIFSADDCAKLKGASKVYVAGFSSQGGGHTERMLMPLAAAVRAENTADRQGRTAIVLVLPPHWENDKGNEADKLAKYTKEYEDANVDVITVQSDKAILGFYKDNGPSDNFRILEEFANKPNRDSNNTPLFGPEKGTNAEHGQAFTHHAIMEKIMRNVGDKRKVTVFEDMDPYLAKAAANEGVPGSHIVGQSNHLMLLDADKNNYFNGKSNAFLVKANGNGHIGNVAAIQFSTEINTTKPLSRSLDELKITREHTAVAAREQMVQMLLAGGKKHDLKSEDEVPMAGCVMVSPDATAENIDRGFYLYLNKYTNILGQHIRERLNGDSSNELTAAYKKAMFVVCGTQAFDTEKTGIEGNAMHVAQAASFDGVTAAGFGGLSEMHYLISNEAYHGNLLVMPVQKQHEQETNADVLLPDALADPHKEKVDTAKEINVLKQKFDDMVFSKATTNEKLRGKTMKPLHDATHADTKKATDKAVKLLTTHGGMTADEKRILFLNFQTANDPKTKALRRINKVMIPALKAMSVGNYIVQTRMTAKVPTRYTAVDDLIKQLRDPMKANELLDLDVFTPQALAECKRFADFLQEIQNKPSGLERMNAAYKFMHEEYANEMFFVGY